MRFPEKKKRNFIFFKIGEGDTILIFTFLKASIPFYFYFFHILWEKSYFLIFSAALRKSKTEGRGEEGSRGLKKMYTQNLMEQAK